MIKVQFFKNGEIIEVTRNEAHGLIEKGLAKIYVEYEQKVIRPSRGRRKGYSVKKL